MAKAPRLVFLTALIGLLAVPAMANAQAKSRGTAVARPSRPAPTARRSGPVAPPRVARPGGVARIGVGRVGRIGRPGMRGFGAGRGVGGGRGRGSIAAPVSVGYLRLRMNLPTAQVYIDGMLAGTVADFSGLTNHLELAAGSHQLEIRAPGYESVQRAITVSADKTLTERATLKKK